jgi:hypothetical protein
VSDSSPDALSVLLRNRRLDLHTELIEKIVEVGDASCGKIGFALIE